MEKEGPKKSKVREEVTIVNLDQKKERTHKPEPKSEDHHLKDNDEPFDIENFFKHGCHGDKATDLAQECLFLEQEMLAQVHLFK